MTNNQPKIVVYSPDQAENYADMIRREGYANVFSASNPAEAKETIEDTDILLCWKFPLHLLEDTSSIKWIQSLGAGVDDIVNSPHVPEQILISRIVDQFGVPIAEYVFSYLLHVNQRIAEVRAAQKEKTWKPFEPELLSGKTIGIAGLGSIGAEIVRKARAFDMTVCGLSGSGKHAHLVDKHYFADEWHEFVKELDYLVLVLPFTENTRHLVNRDVFSAMKKRSAYLINVGRGQVVVEDDLVDVLQSGHLQGAILDVFEQEPLPKESPLWELPNVYVTPHLSGISTPERVGDFFLENLKRYMTGKALKGIVDRKAGY
jgi:glyoxylate/hydroxypyruvate reductase A